MMKWWNKRARRKGDIILMSLMTMIMIVILAGAFINIFMTYETLNRGIAVVEEAARVRAQAIDVPLKEFSGYIEILHPNYGYLERDNVDHNTIDEDFKKAGAAGHTKPQNPASDVYQSAATAADEAAKEAALRLLSQTAGTNAEGSPLISMTKDDFCFDIEPLPIASQMITFTCQTGNGDTVTRDIFVSSLDTNTYTSAVNPSEKIMVRNVVFVGAVFKYEYLIYGSLVNLGWNIGAKKETYAVAYPQINKCTPVSTGKCDTN